MIKSYDQLLSSVRKDFLEAVDQLKRQTLEAFLRSMKREPGVYMIFSEGGELLYVGRTRQAIRGRIQHHLSPKSDSGLLYYICRDRGLVSGIRKSHQCVCGRLIGCTHGSHVSPISKEVQDVAAVLKRTCTIVTLSTAGAAYSGSNERLLTEVLKPKYGFHNGE